ncbi:IS110 family transposase [Solirhodobacter olei]|uniref:IS110 family transposase n=1 Tax=Solirhodobacter olei TaxID=2493082 RepID=UPI001F4EF30E|nr:IS110 family transposase [Solirhodobacter olei]
MDAKGGVRRRAVLPTDQERIAAFIAAEAPQTERVVHESGILSTWLTRELERRGVSILCIDARLANKVLSARLNKSDKVDAESLAQLARTGWLTRVHIHSEASNHIRAPVGARERLIRMRKELEAHLRGMLKTYGIRMTQVHQAKARRGFRDQLSETGAGDPVLRLLAETMSPIHGMLCAATAALDGELLAIARRSELEGRLMSVPGIGTITALGFVATLDDPARFRRVSDVGAFLGLTPRRYLSSEVDRPGCISKCGDADMRRLLVSAVATLITQVARFSPLKAWTVRLSARKGFKKAVVARARKLAVILYAIWRDGSVFRWTKEATAYSKYPACGEVRARRPWDGGRSISANRSRWS